MVVINTSSVKQLVDPPIEQVYFLLFEDPKAWEFTPDASIKYSKDDKKHSLLIAHASDTEYYVQFLENLSSLWILVLDQTNLDPRVVEIDQDYCVSAGLLCDMPLAWKAIEWFCKYGTRCPSLNWMSDHEMPPNVRF